MPSLKKIHITEGPIVDLAFGGHRRKWRPFIGLLCAMRCDTRIGVRFRDVYSKSSLQYTIQTLSYSRGRDLPHLCDDPFHVEVSKDDPQLVYITKYSR